MPDASTTRAGRLVLVVGPSGAGKDTLMRLAAAGVAHRPDIRFPRRLVTRPAGAFEDHDTIDEAAFAVAQEKGLFPLSWRAHGLGYALPGAILSDLAQGDTVVVNVSRGVVAEARSRFPAVDVVLITAPVEELARRVAARGREANAAERVKRMAPDSGELAPDLVIENVGSPTDGAAALIAFLSRPAVGAVA